MNTETPLVSVIITTYKRPTQLKRAIQSVLNQDYNNIEVIVVDDNNPDTEGRQLTEIVMAEFQGVDTVKYVRHTTNQNGAAARNTGIEQSTGEYISYLDDDDWYYPNKISTQLETLQNQPSYEVIYCGWKNGGKMFIPKYQGDITDELLSGEVRLITNAIFMTKKSAVAAGGWDTEFTRNQEFAFLLRVLQKGYQIGYTKEILFEVDNTDTSNASHPIKNEKDFTFFLDKHKHLIEKSPKAKTIYSYRYRGVFLKYVKTKHYKEALKLYLKMLKQLPLKFNYDLIHYTINRLRGKDFYA